MSLSDSDLLFMISFKASVCKASEKFLVAGIPRLELSGGRATSFDSDSSEAVEKNGIWRRHGSASEYLPADQRRPASCKKRIKRESEKEKKRESKAKSGIAARNGDLR